LGAAGGAGATASSTDASGGDDSAAGRSWQRSVIERVIATLFEYRLELVSAFKLFDVDGNGIITREEFRKGLQALTSLTGSPITDMQADELMRALDRDGSGTIAYSEFVDAFAVVDSSKPKGAAAGAGGSSPSAMARAASLKSMGTATRKL
jgi:EF-hand domain pair